MSKERMAFADASWLLMEAPDRPMHVATLLIYSLPPGAPPDFLSRMVASLRECTEFADPFNRRLSGPVKLTRMLPWEQDFDPDLEYHVRHSALPYPGGERELGMLVSRLHSNRLDFTRPLWEYHVIEGLENNRFAVYFKMHHALVDGIAGVRMLQRSMSTRREDLNTPALWSAHAPTATPVPPPPVPDESKSLAERLEGLKGLAEGLRDMVAAARDPGDPMTGPFQTELSILNHRISTQRRFATQTYEFSRIRRLSKTAGCTINDVVLALCSGALRRFLKDLGALPPRSLTAGVPVSLRPKEDQSAGSAVGFMIASLATHIADPERRLAAIVASTRRAKAMMENETPETAAILTAAMMAPQILQMVLGLEGRTRPVYSVPISNVPGPTEPLYFRGARLESMYPVSAVMHGQALNITCYSYAGTLSFGFAGCRDTLPHLQRIAVYSGESLAELERAFLPAADAAEARAESREREAAAAKKPTARKRRARATADK